jgi:hypothetical protein
VIHAPARLVAWTIVAALATPAGHAHAFWELEGSDAYVDARGFVRSSTVRSENPDERLLYPNPSDASTLVAARLFMEGESGESIGVETNVLYTAAVTTVDGLGLVRLPSESFRWEKLRWEAESRGVDHSVVVDRAVLRASLLTTSKHPVDMRFGRLPINLATTFYFTPNDLFAPFSADTFFRLYKPGVDGARVDVQLGDLSQLSVIGVLGYGVRSGGPSLGRTSGILRLVTSVSDIEWALLAGVIPERAITGASFQGELWKWLGFRGEGHYAVGTTSGVRDRVELVVGADHRFESTLSLRFEQFYHGSGFADADEYLKVAVDPERVGLYLGRHYSAFGAGYEVTPLLTAEGFALHNWGDSSSLVGVNLVYSVADEVELAASGTVPTGDAPDFSRFDALDVGSEFGLYPSSFAVDFRAWF